MKTRRTYKTPDTYLSHPTSRALGWDKIYIGKVKNSVDAQCMGRLQVWIPELCADVSQETNPSTWITVSYASMFGGATDVGQNSNENTFAGTQKSYGWWGVPPDRNVQVGIFFANGDPGRGFWFCCLFDEQMNNMIPGIGGGNCETNRKTTRATSTSPKPKFEPLDEALTEQGTQTDNLRGISLSTARREGDYGTDTVETSLTHKQRPAKVYGILSPGGHHFVMDDGFTNTNGDVENSLIRFRTRNGSQILIDDTTGFIYFITRNGKTWLEITDQYGGNVDIYSEGNVSVHAENGDITLKAGKDIIMEAGGSIHTTAGEDIVTRAVGNLDVKSDKETTHESGGDMNLRTGSTMKQTSTSTFNINASGDFLVTAPRVDLNGPAAATADTAETPKLPERTPEHEPWDVHTFASNTSLNADSSGGRASYPQGQTIADGDTRGALVDASEVIPFSGTLPGTICGMSEDETRKWLGALSGSESGGRYTIQNGLGYSGKYQFGEIALKDIGFIRQDTPLSGSQNFQKALNDPKNWKDDQGRPLITVGDGVDEDTQINSIEDYLASADAQELAIVRFTNKNCETLENKGVPVKSMSLPDKSGYLMAAHLGGAGGSSALFKSGESRSDGNATTASYRALGRSIFDQDI